MTLHRATYGIDRGGHALLQASTPELKKLFSEVAWRTDLPPHAPYGVEWQPFLRGFPETDHYVLIRIEPDVSAGRAGMVRSQAVFIPFDMLDRTLDLERLFAAIRQMPDRDIPLEPLEATFRDGEAPVQPSAISLGIVEALVASKKLPIVHLGQEGFDEAALELLGRLPDPMRRQFSFRLSFGPQDIENDQQTVVATPASSEHRWHNFQIARVSSAREATSAAGMLLGLPEGAGLANFAAELGARVSDLRTLSLLSSAHDLSRSEEASPTALLRLVDVLSPAAAEGVGIKARLLAAGAAAVGAMSIAQIRGLKNLSLSAFGPTKDFWSAVRRRIPHFLTGGVVDRSVFTILKEALAGGAVPSWSEAVSEGFRDGASPLSAPAGRTMWDALVEDASSGPPVLDRLPRDPATEATIASSMPLALAPNTASALLPAVRERNWLSLYGQLLAASHPPAEAVRMQLEIDSDPRFESGVKAAVSRAGDAEILAIALLRTDARLVRLAAEACVRTPSLTLGFDAKSPAWLEILLSKPGLVETIDRDRDLLDALIRTDSRDTARWKPLWNAVGVSAAADIWDLPARRETWHRIPFDLRPTFLAATADGWLASWQDGRNLEPAVESELANFITDRTRILPFLSRCIPDRLGSAIALFRQFDRLSETLFIDWLGEIESRMKFGGVVEADAQAIGDLVSLRFWRSAAYAVLDMARRRGDMMPALNRCQWRLDIFDTLSLWRLPSMRKPDVDDLWRVLEDIVVGLYAQGPQEGEIWSRAGGAMDVLEWSGNGRTRWRSALRRLRAGGGGTNASRLVAEMRSEYPANPDLESIAAFDIFKPEERDA